MLTEGEAGEHVLEGREQLVVTSVSLEVNLPEVRRTVHRHLHIRTALQNVPSERPHWWPPHHLRPVYIMHVYLSQRENN